MSLTLDSSQVANLITYVDRQVRRDGCDHTLRFAEAWARQEGIDWHDLLDILEANAGYCDCEVVLNLPDGPELQAPPTPAPAPTGRGNPWLLPPNFECDPATVFTKVIVCQAGLGRNTYANDGELLVPAPRGAKPRRRVRKSANFFIGCQSGLPTEVGVVCECSGTSAAEFACRVAESGFEELAAFAGREAAFVLTRIATVPPGKPVGTHFADQIGIASRHEELRVHRVVMR
jgi:hypothetical protein